MSWFRRHHSRDPGELNRIAIDAEENAEAMQQDANETARRVNPTLTELERRKHENKIYASVIDTLGRA